MGDSREFDASGIFWGFLLIVGGGELITIEDPSVSALGYQLLPLATGQLMGDTRELDASGIFLGFLLIVGGRELIAIEDQSVSALSYQLLSLVTSQLVGGNSGLMFHAYFHLFNLLLVEGSL